MKTAKLLPLVLAGSLVGGCASFTPPAVLNGTTNTWYAVTPPQTPFYRYGPQQGNGPDMQLQHDAIMKVIRPSFGYVKVQLQDGKDGYVASEAIRPAPATLVAEKLAPPPPLEATPAMTVASHGEQFDLNSDDPRLLAPPEPLPEPSPIPEFRY